jgi:cell division protein FtsL
VSRPVGTARTAAPLRREAPSRDRLRHLEVVRDEARRLQLRLTPRAGVTLTVLLFAALFAVAVSHALLIESQSHLDQLDDQVAEEQARYQRLRMDVAELESPERIMADATEMGMVPPADPVWITPDRPVAAGSEATESSDTDSTDTSWSEVKPILGSTP